MKRNDRAKDIPAEDILAQLLADQQLIDSLSRGIDPSEGRDSTACALLALRSEIHADTPAAPDIVALLAEQNLDVTSQAPVSVQPQDAPITVDELRARRATRGRHRAQHRLEKPRKTRHFAAGLVGAAAATLVLAGAGAVIYNADNDSPLYSVQQQLFNKNDTVAVELASTLQQVNEKNAAGDIEGARQLLEQAQQLLDEMRNGQNQKAQPQVIERTTTVTQPPVTETITSTVTVTATPTPEPSTLPSTSEVPAEPVAEQDQNQLPSPEELLNQIFPQQR